MGNGEILMSNKANLIKNVLSDNVYGEVKFIVENKIGESFTLYDLVIIDSKSIKAVVTIKFDNYDNEYELWNYVNVESFFHTSIYNKVLKSIDKMNEINGGVQ